MVYILKINDAYNGFAEACMRDQLVSTNLNREMAFGLRVAGFAYRLFLIVRDFL
jgi:hypothetical protein